MSADPADDGPAEGLPAPPLTGAAGLPDAPHTHKSLLLRVILATLGGLFVALAVIGIFLPVVPTVPLLLLAAACFARSSTRIYRWLINHPRLGPPIREWRLHRSIPYRSKRAAVLLIALSFTVSIVFLMPYWPARIVMAIAGVLLGVWIWRQPSRDDPRRREGTIGVRDRNPP